MAAEIVKILHSRSSNLIQLSYVLLIRWCIRPVPSVRKNFYRNIGAETLIFVWLFVAELSSNFRAGSFRARNLIWQKCAAENCLGRATGWNWDWWLISGLYLFGNAQQLKKLAAIRSWDMGLHAGTAATPISSDWIYRQEKLINSLKQFASTDDMVWQRPLLHLTCSASSETLW